PVLPVSSRRGRGWFPSSSECLRKSSVAISSRTARAAAQATGFPPNVPPRPPVSGASITSARPGPPARGSPPPRAAGDPRQREPSPERLARDEQVGLDAEVLDRPDRAGAAYARLHLVIDVEGPVLAAELEQARGELVGERDEPALALHRLDDDARDVVLGQQRRDVLERVVR